MPNSAASLHRGNTGLNCYFCNEPTAKSRSTSKYVSCGREECRKARRLAIALDKLKRAVQTRGSLHDHQPDVAKTLIRVIKPGYEHLTASDVTCKASIEADWQCPDITYHKWDQRIDRRVAHPNCPYCTGQRVHENDSLYKLLVERHELQLLHPDQIEKSKKLLPGG